MCAGRQRRLQECRDLFDREVGQEGKDEIILAMLVDQVHMSPLCSLVASWACNLRRQPLGYEMHRQAADADGQDE